MVPEEEPQIRNIYLIRLQYCYGDIIYAPIHAPNSILSPGSKAASAGWVNRCPARFRADQVEAVLPDRLRLTQHDRSAFRLFGPSRLADGCRTDMSGDGRQRN